MELGRFLVRTVVRVLLCVVLIATAVSPTANGVASDDYATSAHRDYSYDAPAATTTPAAHQRAAALIGGRSAPTLARSSPSLMPSRRAAKAGEEGLDGASRTYISITKGRSSVKNVGTDATHDEFAETLTARGWSSRTLGNGKATLFEKDGARYSLRERADSYDGWTADYMPPGAKKTTLKIRLGYP